MKFVDAFRFAYISEKWFSPGRGVVHRDILGSGTMSVVGGFQHFGRSPQSLARN
jgi:hypothetical protein